MKASTIVRGAILQVLLPLLAIGVALTVIAVAPNIVQVIDMFGKPRRFSRKHFRQSLRRLEKKGYLRHRKNTEWDYVLTKAGARLLRGKEIEKIEIKQPAQWDGKWRMVLFDIPEKMREARDVFRWKLQELGFQYLNLSVWVHPYECRDEINAIVEYYNVGRYVRYVRAESFDGARVMQRRFHLH